MASSLADSSKQFSTQREKISFCLQVLSNEHLEHWLIDMIFSSTGAEENRADLHRI